MPLMNTRIRTGASNKPCTPLVTILHEGSSSLLVLCVHKAYLWEQYKNLHPILPFCPFLHHSRQLKEEEEKQRQFVVKECERVLQQKDLVIRLQPLGLDRNHDRYWLFNATTPGLYVEKGWVDHHTTYSTQVRMILLFSLMFLVTSC